MKIKSFSRFDIVVAALIVIIVAVCGYLILHRLHAATTNADINGDGSVNGGDLAILAANYNKAGTFTFAQGDIDGDGHVNITDLTLLAINWGASGGGAPEPFRASGNNDSLPTNLIFSDEFNGSSVDTTKWNLNWYLVDQNTLNSPPDNNSNLNCENPNQATEGGGVLSLTAIQQNCSTWTGGPFNYASGLISSKGHFSLTSGYIEARILFPTSSSGSVENFPAWWAVGEPWPTDGELDVVEGLGGCLNYHFHSPAGGPGGSCGSYISNDSGWHIYGANFQAASGLSCSGSTPNAVIATYYYDGVNVGSTPATCIDNVGMYLVLDNDVPSSGSTVPATMQVDYVRVWQ